MNGEAYDRLRAEALEAIVAELRASVGVDRCTLRLDVEGEYFPVVHESRTTAARSLIGDREVSLKGQPVVEAILGGATQVVQPDTASASEDPAFKAMLGHYGGLGAQIVTPVRDRGSLLAIISLHHLGGPREWSAHEKQTALDGAELVRRLVAPGAVVAGEPG
jgi:GAF domain-containing protein